MRIHVRASLLALVSLQATLLLGDTGCSLLVETRSQQCQGDVDCAGFNGGAAHCDTAQHVCVEGTACDQHGTDCVCDPKTNDDFLNACTDSPCVAFDDATRLPSTPAGNGMKRSFSSVPFMTPDIGLKCKDVGKQPIYIAGPKSMRAFLTVIGKQLWDNGKGPLIVFQQTTSCDALDYLFTPGKTLIAGAGGVYFNGDDAANDPPDGTPCDIDDAPPADIGGSETAAQSCSSHFQGPPPDIGLDQGPIEAMSFVAPSGSTQQVISHDAANRVYLLGGKSGVAPWTDEKFIFERDPQSGTQNVIAQIINVDVDFWQGQRTTSTGDEIAKIQALQASEPPATLNKVLGEMAANEAENTRGTGLKQLAYQHANQACGYYPDTAPQGTDKANVRDGHYALWAPLQLAFRKTGANKAGIAQVISYLNGTAFDVDLVVAAAKAHLIPQCAMHVQRTNGDGGDMTPFQPKFPCSCYYDSLTGKTPSCQKCSPKDGCPSGTTCSSEYCEPDVTPQ